MPDLQPAISKLTPARRRALEGIRDGLGRCGLSRSSGYLVPPGDVRNYVVGEMQLHGYAERGEKVNKYAYTLVLTEKGRATLDG